MINQLLSFSLPLPLPREADKNNGGVLHGLLLYLLSLLSLLYWFLCCNAPKVQGCFPKKNQHHHQSPPVAVEVTVWHLA